MTRVGLVYASGYGLAYASGWDGVRDISKNPRPMNSALVEGGSLIRTIVSGR